MAWLAAWRLGGWWAVLALKAALLGAAGAVVWRTLALYGLPAAARGPWLLAWALALLPADDARPENFSVLLFSLEWALLEADRLRERPAAVSWREAGWAAGFFALWANLHAGFVYGLGLLGLAAASAGRPRRRRLALLACAGASATLLNPAGWRLYPVLVEHARALGDLSRLLREWQPPALADCWLAPFWLLLAVAFGVVLRRQWSGSMPLFHAAAVALLGLSAGRHVRTAPYFVAVAVPVAAAGLGWPAGRWARGAAWLAAAGLLAFWGARVAPVLARGQAFRPAYAPERIARFLEREQGALGGKRLFHPMEWGGYLGWTLGGRHAVFADGRYIFHDLLEPVYEARQSPEAFQDLLERWRVDVALIQHDPARVEMEVQLKEGIRVIERPSYLFFLPRQRWALVHFDDDGLVFARRSAVPEAWLKTREYKLFRPGDLEAAGLQVAQGLSRAEDLEAERSRHAAAALRP